MICCGQAAAAAHSLGTPLATIAVVAKELKNDLKADVRRIETIVEDVEQRVKEDSRENAKDLKETISELKQEMSDLEEKIQKQIRTALENPLNKMKWDIWYS